MHSGLRVFYLFFYLVLFVVAVIAICGQCLSAQTIETFSAGPTKQTYKHVSYVKTTFTWTDKYSFCCQKEDRPCIRAFLDKSVPEPGPRFTREIENSMLEDLASQGTTGAYAVPSGIVTSSVQLLWVPFCSQLDKKKSRKVSNSRKKSSRSQISQGGLDKRQALLLRGY